MRASQTMHMLIKVHHLEPIELSRHLLNLLFFVIRDIFNTGRIPFDVCSGSFFVLPTSFDGTAGYLAVMNVLNLMVAHGACFDLGSTHVDGAVVNS
jgi:hypothetical protein